MAGKYLCVNLHVIWSTKNRRRILDPQWADRLHAYFGSIARAKNAKLIVVNNEPDHIHLYVSMPSTISIADLINAFKSNSTRWIRQTFPNRKWFSWQEGYAAFSVSRYQEQTVIEYIQNQQIHHKGRDFREELLELLNRHKIEYDMRYVFD
jgi:putative transposase